jgi:hypothetical protein
MADEAGPFSDWAAVVVAGDWHAQSGAPSEVFDNARRDIAKSLVQIGFSADNVRQLSVRPERYAKSGALPTKPRQLYETLGQLTTKVTGGCLVYITSHGVPEGIVFGPARTGRPSRSSAPAIPASLCRHSPGRIA